MKAKASGVAKWSVLRRTLSVAPGIAAASESEGPAKSLSPIQTRTLAETRWHDSRVTGFAGIGRRRQARSASASLPGRAPWRAMA